MNCEYYPLLLQPLFVRFVSLLHTHVSKIIMFWPLKFKYNISGSHRALIYNHWSTKIFSTRSSVLHNPTTWTFLDAIQVTKFKDIWVVRHKWKGRSCSRCLWVEMTDCDTVRAIKENSTVLILQPTLSLTDSSINSVTCQSISRQWGAR